MPNILQPIVIILAGVSIGVADFLIKKIALKGGFLLALKDPWMIAIIVLYFIQIAFLFYVFRNQGKIGIVGNLQMVFYSLTVVILGLVVFGEKISIVQGVGILLAVIGAILMSV
ncbi:MAG: hypothetical protein PHU42_00435 [Patescibacteria group bacterium]|nr:hypothetical protein [Patescibacteria group bacterium]